MSNTLQPKSNKEWYPYKDMGTYYRLVDGYLQGCPMLEDGSFDPDEAFDCDYELFAGDPIIEKWNEIKKELGAKE